MTWQLNHRTEKTAVNGAAGPTFLGPTCQDRVLTGVGFRPVQIARVFLFPPLALLFPGMAAATPGGGVCGGDPAGDSFCDEGGAECAAGSGGVCGDDPAVESAGDEMGVCGDDPAVESAGDERGAECAAGSGGCSSAVRRGWTSGTSLENLMRYF